MEHWNSTLESGFILLFIDEDHEQFDGYRGPAEEQKTRQGADTYLGQTPQTLNLGEIKQIGYCWKSPIFLPHFYGNILDPVTTPRAVCMLKQLAFSSLEVPVSSGFSLELGTTLQQQLPEQEFLVAVPVALQSSVDTLSLQEGEWGSGSGAGEPAESVELVQRGEHTKVDTALALPMMARLYSHECCKQMWMQLNKQHRMEHWNSTLGSGFILTGILNNSGSPELLCATITV
ncbi:hypothetical protein HPG69_005844, partial [Diceros bicornis minor]